MSARVNDDLKPTVNEPMNQCALLLIDIQCGLDAPGYGQRNNANAEDNMTLLLSHWRSHAWPLIHVKHNSTETNSPLRPGIEGNAIKDCVKPLPNETLIEKTVNSAFIGTNLEQYLHKKGISSLVVVGLTTDHCVSTSVRMAANLGFKVYLVADATATFERKSFDGTHLTAEQMHAVNLASLNDEFCTVLNTRDVLETKSNIVV